MDIREEIVNQIDSRNVISRNRYGALVWNTTEFTILDLDRHRPNFCERWGFKKRDPKQAIWEDLEKLSKKKEYRDLCFRIYETFQGYRVIILGRYYEPRSPEFNRLVYDTNTDWLYSSICKSQNCYRARLSPKPYRIKFKGIRYKWPMDSAEYDEAQRWVNEYETASEKYATCRYVTTLGSAVIAPSFSLHDRETGAETNKKLA